MLFKDFCGIRNLYLLRSKRTLPPIVSIVHSCIDLVIVTTVWVYVCLALTSAPASNPSGMYSVPLQQIYNEATVSDKNNLICSHHV